MKLLKRLGHLSYDGTDYHGFSISPGKATIQQAVENSISRIFHDKSLSSQIDFSSRTDAGVHAFDQLITFDAPSYFENQKLLFLLNQILPKSIRIQKLESVSDTFNLRDRIRAKIYQYVISNEIKNPFKNRFAWTMRILPKLESLSAYLKLMIGKHDFSSFAKESKRYISTICEIYRIECYPKNKFKDIVIDIEGDRFLYNMIRRMVGFSVFLSLKEKILPSTYKDLLNLYQIHTNMKAPACGLTLFKVFFDND